MSWKEELVKGKARGAPLFLAWSVGVFAVYLLNGLIAFLADFYSLWPQFRTSPLYSSLMLFAVWQGILLLPQWWRRIVWTLLYGLGVGTIVFLHPSETEPWTIATTAGLLQGVLFIGIRRRFWLWMLVLGIQWLLEGLLMDVSFDLYTYFLSRVRDYLPTALSLEREILYPLVLIVILGAVAAYFMPPIDPAQSTAEADARSKAKWRKAFVILTVLLAALFWFFFGQQMIMLRAARKARTREQVRNLRLKYPILLSHARPNAVVGVWEYHFDLYHHCLYQRKHAFTWGLDANLKVVSYDRITETFLFRFGYDDDESR